MPQRYMYTGPIYRETRKFRVLRGGILVNLFAAGEWRYIITDPHVPGTVITRNFTGPAIGPNVTYDSVQIAINDAVQNHTTVLRGGLYVQNNAPADGFIVIIFSGSGGPSKEYVGGILQGYLTIPSIHRFVKACLCVDYRGFGLSRHLKNPQLASYKPTPAYMPGTRALYTDASAMIEFCTNHLNIPAHRIILHGYSLGSGPACQMSKDAKPHAGIVLHGPMRSASYEAFKAMTPSSTGGKAAAYALTLGILPAVAGVAAGLTHGNAGFVNIDKVGDLTVPALVTSGPNDSMWDSAKSLYEKLRKRPGNVLTFLSVHGGDHEDTNDIFDNNPQPKRGIDSPRRIMELFLHHLTVNTPNWAGRAW
jgi:predicted esterase